MLTQPPHKKKKKKKTGLSFSTTKMCFSNAKNSDRLQKKKKENK